MKIFPVLLSIFFISNVYAQDSLQRRHGPDTTTTIKRIALIGGLHAGKYVYGEIGFGRSVMHFNPAHGMFSWGASVSSEIQIGKDILFGPKLSVTGGSMGLVEGVSAIYYTDFKKGTFVLRPEIGFGIADARLTYGYNLRIGDKVKRKEMAGINSNVISIIVFPVTIASKETKVPAHH
jgi:hypothetical protein